MIDDFVSAGYQMTPDRRRILTIEMAMTALAAVRRKTRTACLNNEVYIRIVFSMIYGIINERL
jgi:hypothetical protein